MGIWSEEEGVSKTFRPYEPDQIRWLPVALPGWLAPNHLAPPRLRRGWAASK